METNMKEEFNICQETARQRDMDDSERYNAEPKTITFQKDYESLINEKNSWIERIEDKLKDFLKSGLKGIKDILNEILGDDKDE